MKILLDCDGVIANFVDGACKLHQRPDPYGDEKNIDNGNMQKIWGMTSEEFTKGMDYDFWEGLEKTEHATQIVAVLESAFGRENICILTKPTPTRGACDGKRAWIMKHFPQYGERFLIGPTKTFCSHSNSLLVDDYIKNCRKFVNQGGRAYLVPAKWNHKHNQDPLQDLMGFLGMIFATGMAV